MALNKIVALLLLALVIGAVIGYGAGFAVHQSQISQLQLALSTPQSDISRLKSALSATQSDLSEAQSEITSLKSNLSKTLSDLSDTRLEVASLQEQLRRAEDEISNLFKTQSDLTEALSEFSKALSYLSDTRLDVVSLREQLREAKTAISNLNSTLRGIKEELTQTYERIEELGAELVKVRDIEYKRSVEALLGKVLERVGEVRGLSPPEIELKMVNVSWVKENWGRGYVEANAEEIRLDESIYKALFIIPQNFSLAEVFIEWSGYYMAAALEREVYVVRENFNPEDKSAERTLAHEVTHAIQGRYFPAPERKTHDGEKAWSALIEGDADLTADKYMEIKGLSTYKTGRFPSIILALKPSGVEVPGSMLKIFYFPYDYGEDFVRTLYARDGWDSVNEAYGNPPTTTEEVMHPERYLAGEGATEVEAPGINTTGWRQKKRDTLGEHFILVMLSTSIPETEAERAADGWGGDNLTYYERNDNYLFTWKISWDSDGDASEFHDSFINMMNELGAEEIEPLLWRINGEYISLKRVGSTTLITGSTERFLQTRRLALCPMALM